MNLYLTSFNWKEICFTENEGETPPVFVHPLTDVTVKENTGFELKCLVEGNPLPIVQWHKDNICIDNNSDYNITYNNGEAILKFDAIKVLDQADYSCKATNRLGSETTSAKVTVECKLNFTVMNICLVIF